MSRIPENLEESVLEQMFGPAIDDYGTRYCYNLDGAHCSSCISDQEYGYDIEICCDHWNDVEKVMKSIDEDYSRWKKITS